ncbi:MAG: hypothetical protein KatS3mg071_1957 [Meiothermus sp.]|nr:MAG: hypothetical protein KatS3mg071_1957 [Meiothermus sp.]
MSLGVLAFETTGVLMLAVIRRTVWHDFDIDYGFLQLIQPITP